MQTCHQRSLGFYSEKQRKSRAQQRQLHTIRIWEVDSTALQECGRRRFWTFTAFNPNSDGPPVPTRTEPQLEDMRRPDGGSVGQPARVSSSRVGKLDSCPPAPPAGWDAVPVRSSGGTRASGWALRKTRITFIHIKNKNEPVQSLKYIDLTFRKERKLIISVASS